MPRGQKVSALLVVAAALLGLAYTAISGNEPLLGLDLQGGVSVVLEPSGTTGAQAREVTDEALDLTVELLRARIDEIGVAEPEISRQGENIVVGLPGLVEDQEESLARLRQTAELRFRPVLVPLGPALNADSVSDTVPADEADGTDTVPGDDTTGSTEVDTTGSGSGITDSTAAEESMVGGGRFGALLPAPASTSATTAPGSTTATTIAADDAGATTTVADGTGDTTDSTTVDGAPTGDGATAGDEPVDLGVLENCLSGETTPDDEDRIDDYVILTDRDGLRYCLGPAVIDGELLTGDMVETATVGLGPEGWQVNPTFNAGADGIDKFNQIAAVCFSGDQEVCPSRQLAVVLDHQVISAPVINAARFTRDQIVISGSFTEDEARRLAESLRFGALPLELVAQETRTVSATIGQDVLTAGLVAGAIGLAMVAIYLLAFYRLAGMVAIAGLLLSAALLWTIVAWFGATFGLALTLAGVVGLIVAIGVSADSNIVYFENVKDSYRSGRRVPTAVERAYQSAISTIVKADVVSLIAAVLLYLLTVGAVRGFAFYLGLATILDLVISWLFMRPALAWLARRKAVEANPRLLGLPASAGPDGPAAPASAPPARVGGAR